MFSLTSVLARVILPLILALLSFSLVHAESVQWNTQIPQPLFYQQDTGNQCYGAMQNTSVSVSYQAQATNVATGASVCGATIPEGTQIRFQFTPHTYQDISWFTTGFNHDSPYGDWVQGATAPTSEAQWCNANNFAYYFGSYADSIGKYMQNEAHVPLHVEPPEKSLGSTGNLTCGAPDADGSVTCTAGKSGTVAPSFDFTETFGRFYLAFKWDSHPNWNWTTPCTPASSAALRSVDQSRIQPYYDYYQTQCTADDTYDLIVPTQSILCPITVTDADGDPPGNPNVNTVGGSCTVGTPYSITATATDPDGDALRYGIDWDANGTIDQFVPSTGYVPSGTSQTVSRTYATEGSKTVKVMAVDENGLTSSWTTLTFSCTDAGAQGQGAGENLGGGDEGSGGGGGGGATPNLTIRAIPSLVRTGETTNLHWSASNVTACTVVGDNGDTFTGTTSQEPQGNQSSAITQQTTYTLSCTDADDNTLTQSTTVNILPVWSEF